MPIALLPTRNLRSPVLGVALVLWLVVAGAAPAATITVNSMLDNGDGANCTLREAIQSANTDMAFGGCSAGAGADEIVFDNSLSGSTITLRGVDLDIRSELRIDGDLDDDGSPDVTVHGDDISRVFYIEGAGVNAILEGLTITGGYTNRFNSSNGGSGIFVWDANLILIHSSVTGNTTEFDGGGIAAQGITNLAVKYSTISDNIARFQGGGGIAVTGNTILALENSTVSGNVSSRSGGGIIAGGVSLTLENSAVSGNVTSGAGGGIHAIGSSLTLENSTVSGNVASSSGGGIAASEVSLTLENSAVSGNTAGFGGGGIALSDTTFTLKNSAIFDNYSDGDGGGFFVWESNIDLENSTVYDNFADSHGGGIAAQKNTTFTLKNSTVFSNFANGRGGGIEASGNTTFILTNSTIFANAAYEDGGGIDAFGSVLILENSTVFDNIATDQGDSLSAPDNTTEFHVSNSIIASTSGVGDDCFLNGSTILINVNNHFGDESCDGTGGGDPQLGPLTDNGGPTLTHLPQIGSPVIDAGNNAAVPPGLTSDQRGGSRIFNFTVDIGAVEYASNADCSSPPDDVAIDFDLDCSPGNHLCDGVRSITTHAANQVIIQSGAEVYFRAPQVGFNSGFSVQAGGVIHVRTTL